MYDTGWAKSRPALDCLFTFRAEILCGYWQILDRSGKEIILLSPLLMTTILCVLWSGHSFRRYVQSKWLTEPKCMPLSANCGSWNLCMRLFKLFEKLYICFFISIAKCRNIVKCYCRTVLLLQIVPKRIMMSQKQWHAEGRRMGRRPRASKPGGIQRVKLQK